MSTIRSSGVTASKVVYWHRELPPAHSEMMHEHVIEAVSDRIPGAIERHGEFWQRCYDELMEHTRFRIEQEVKRLGGDYAHVLDEHIDSRRDDAKGESWLHGRFNYVLYRRTEEGQPHIQGKARETAHAAQDRR